MATTQQLAETNSSNMYICTKVQAYEVLIMNCLNLEIITLCKIFSGVYIGLVILSGYNKADTKVDYRILLLVCLLNFEHKIKRALFP